MKFSASAVACVVALLAICAPGSAWAMDSVWATPIAVRATEGLRLTVTYPAEIEAGCVLRFDCLAEARNRAGNAVSNFVLLAEDGTEVRRESNPVDLATGPNPLTFDLETAGLAEGRYTVLLAITYSDRAEPMMVEIPLRRASSAGLQAKLASLEQQHVQLAATSAADARVGLCREVLSQAAADAQAGNWHGLAYKTDYLVSAQNRIAAGAVFAGSAGPDPGMMLPPTQSVRFTPSGFDVDGTPAYPLGWSIDGADPDGLERAKRLGCQWVNVNLGPADSLTGAGDTANLSALQAFLAKAESLQLLLTVRLRPDRISPAMISRHASIEAKGFADIDQADARVLFEKHLAAVLPVLATQPCVGAVEVVANPYFKFEEERYRQMFIQHVQQEYPDRIDLNRQWHSHLATYEEITLKGEKDYDYQNRRTFQYDWQTYHRGLAFQYLTWADAQVQAVAPNLPRYASFTEYLFDKGVARHEPDRELAAGLFSASAISAAVSPEHEMYALTYPGPAALAALTRSFAPEKPLLFSDYRFDGGAHSPEAAYDIVRTALWDAYIGGVDGLALDGSSPLLSEPAALEGLLTARAEVNAFSRVVQAFQLAPDDIGILFSNSSMIFDNGEPHLESSRYAFEGATFSGYKVGFITEAQCLAGKLAQTKVLIIPDTPALSDAAFKAVSDHVTAGAYVARTGKPIPYNERGMSRHDVVRNTGTTVLVRGMNLPTEYLHAMDAMNDRGALPRIPRSINAFGFPLEGVKSRYVEVDGQPYLYIVNLRKQPIECNLAGSMQTGTNVLDRQAVSFPRTLQPLKPMLIALDKDSNSVTVAAQ